MSLKSSTIEVDANACVEITGGAGGAGGWGAGVAVGGLIAETVEHMGVIRGSTVDLDAQA